MSLSSHGSEGGMAHLADEDDRTFQIVEPCHFLLDRGSFISLGIFNRAAKHCVR